MEGKISFDIGTMTLDEAITFEKMAGFPIDEYQKPGQPKAPALKALVFLAYKRADPATTEDQVGAIPLAELNELIVANDPDSPSGDD